MRSHAFTDEEVKVLRGNKYTAFVSNSSIRFTLEFKEMFLEKKKEGVPARRIFLEAGYDVDILGTSRIKNLSKRIPKEASAPCGLHEGYHIHRKRPEDADYSRMAPEEAMAAMQREIVYLRQELDFIKKIIKTDSTGGQKQ